MSREWVRGLQPIEARALYRDYLMLVRRRVAAERRAAWVPDTLVFRELVLALKREEDERIKVFTAYSKQFVSGRWMLSILGIGPVTATVLLSHVDPTKLQSRNSLYRYTGLDPTLRRERGKRPPWDPVVKAALFTLGESLIKTKSHPESVYGPLWTIRRKYEDERNNLGLLRSEAERTLRRGWRWKAKTREIYESGMLPPQHLAARARRWTVKMFLSHFYEILMWETKGERVWAVRTKNYIPPPNDPRDYSSANPDQDYECIP